MSEDNTAGPAVLIDPQGRTTLEKPTLNLRFVNGRLQQMWEVSEIVNSHLTIRAEEWRDVPEVKQ
jgi:hypothetical protein